MQLFLIKEMEGSDLIQVVMQCEPVGGGAFEGLSQANSNNMLVYMGLFVLANGLLVIWMRYRDRRKAKHEVDKRGEGSNDG